MKVINLYYINTILYRQNASKVKYNENEKTFYFTVLFGFHDFLEFKRSGSLAWN